MICTECGLGDEELPNLVEDCQDGNCPNKKPSDVHNKGPRLRAGTEAALARFKRQDNPVNPAHYRQGEIEVIDVIETYELSFNAGQVIKYVLRHRFKDRALEDLKKARWYLEREISNAEDDDE